MKHFLALLLALMMALTMVGPASAETAGSTVTVAVDDDSFTVGPWGGDGAVRDWTEATMWTHLCNRPSLAPPSKPASWRWLPPRA